MKLRLSLLFSFPGLFIGLLCILVLAVFALMPLARMEAQTPPGFLPEPDLNSSTLQVIQAVPVGQLPSTAAREIVVSFNQALIPLGKVDSSNLKPFRIEPEISGRFRWYGSSVAAFLPDEPLRAGTNYTIIVPAGLKDLEGRTLNQAQKFSFHTEGLKVEYIYPGNSTTIDYNPSIRVRFNLPVDPTRAKSFIEMRAGDSTVPVEVEGPDANQYIDDDEIPQQHLRIQPARALPRGTSVVLTLKKGLPIAGQDGGLEEETVRNYTTYGPVSVLFEDDAKFFQDSYDSGLRFNNEVDPNSAQPFIRLYDEKNVEIKLPEPDEDYSQSFLSISSWPLKPGKSYRVFVRKGLPDIHGNVLPAEKDFRFETRQVRPFLQMEASWGASEAMLSPRIPYRYGNLKEINVEVASIGLDSILAYLESHKNDPHKSLNFKKIPLPVNAGPNQIETRQFDFTGFLNVNRPDGQHDKKTGWIAYRFEAPVLNWEGKKAKASYPGVLQSTDIGLTVRESPFASYVWTYSLSSGEALSGILVRQYDGKSQGGTCETDKTGYCRIEKASTGMSEKALFLALDRRKGHGGDMAFVTARFNRVYNGVEWGSQRAGLPEMRGMILFDRKLYRPGETVQFKAVLSVLERGKLMPFKAGDLKVTINDARGRQIYSKILKPTLQGGVHDALRIPENSPLGHYNIAVVPNMFVGRKAPENMGGVWDNFQVEEFRPLTFTVSVTGTEDRIQAAPAPIRVEGRYLFGAPMSQARASIVVFESQTSIYLNHFPAFETGGFGDSVERIHLRGQGRLDGKGSFTMQMPAGSYPPEKKQYMLAAEYEKARKGKVVSLLSVQQRNIEVRPHRRMRLEAKVFDASNRSVTKNAEYTHYASEVFPALRPVRYVFEENRDASVEVLFADSKGKAVPGRGEVYVFRSVYNVVETKGPSGSLQRMNSLIRILEKHDTIEASGPKVYTFKPSSAGEYEILVRTGDGAFASTTVYVSGRGYGWWMGSDDDSVTLISDKRQYRPGETARILIKSPYEKAKAVITVEREDVLDRRVIDMTSSSQSIDIPLKAEYIPGVHISVMVFRPRTEVNRTGHHEPDPGKPAVKMGTLHIDLATDTKRIPVVIKKSCDPCGPGQEFAVEIRTAPGAEVALDVADRAILDLVGYRFADPVSRFYDSRPYGIRVLDLRGALIDQFLRTGKGEPGGGGDDAPGGGFSLDGEDGMRKNFRYTAEWKPVLVADATGKISLKFRLPDNLTTFRIMALAAKDGLYGKAEEEFRVQKSVVTMPVLPNFVRPGDGIWAGALVINQTGEKSNFVFEFQSNPPLCHDDPSRLNAKDPIPVKLMKEVSLDAGETREILFYCKIPRNPSFLKDLRKEKVDPLNPSFRLDAGAIGFTFRAKGRDLADGMSRLVPLRQEVVREAFTVSGSAAEEASEALLVPDPEENPGELSLQMSGTVLLGLKTGYEFFALNPYMCMEQRTSAAVVNIMAGSFAPSRTGGEYDPAKLNELFYGALPSFQNDDGGLRLWKELESPSDPYLTAYVLESISLLQSSMPAAYKGRVDAVVARALNYLVAYRDNPRKETKFYQIETITYLNYVLSIYDRGRKDLAQWSIDGHEKLSLRGRGYALLTALHLKLEPGETGNKMIDDFKNRLSFSTRKIELRETLPFSASRIYYSRASTVAVWIRYLVERNLHPDFVSKMVLGAMKRNVFYSSSHDEAGLAIAVRRYHEAYEKGFPSSAVSTIDGKEFFRSDFDAKAPLLTTSIETDDLIRRFAIKDIDRPRSLKIMNPSKQGRIYYNATLDYAVDYSKIEPKDEGIYVTREFLDDSMKPVSIRSLRRGEVYPVRLRIISRRPISNFLLRDPLASSTEIVNTAFQTEGLSLSALESSSGSDSPWFDSGEIIEKRYDAYVVTDPYLSAGVHEYIYLVRPIQAGRTLLPPAQAQAMYEPEIFGRTDGGIVEATR